MDTILIVLLHRSIHKDASTRCCGESIGPTVAFGYSTHAFLPGEYVSIRGQDGKFHTFRVVAVDPVAPSIALMSIALIKSFELDIKGRQ